jgi:hypothetical protein
MDRFEGSPFWQEIRMGLFVIQDYDWRRTLNALPEILDPTVAVDGLQSTNQLLNANFTGHAIIKGLPYDITPNTETLAKFLPPDNHYNLECLFLQWMYHYYILEGVCSSLKDEPLAKWPTGLQILIERTLHFLVFVSALMGLLEDGVVLGAPTKEGMAALMPMIQFKLKKITETLLSKTADYGESYRRHGLQGTVPRIWDKIARFAQLSALGRSANYEPKADALRDLLGYCAIAWSLAVEGNLIETEETTNAVHSGS